MKKEEVIDKQHPATSNNNKNKKGKSYAEGWRRSISC
jgi:hypothetical protein